MVEINVYRLLNINKKTKLIDYKLTFPICYSNTLFGLRENERKKKKKGTFRSFLCFD